MVCLYGSFQGLTSSFYLQANLSLWEQEDPWRPEKKLAMITADMLGSLAVHLLTMLVLLCYLLLVLRLDFGNQIGYLLLTVLVGSIVGVSLGALVGAALRIKVEAKTAILITLSLACCFLAGLMVEGISYAIQQNAPAAAGLIRRPGFPTRFTACIIMITTPGILWILECCALWRRYSA